MVLDYWGKAGVSEFFYYESKFKIKKMFVFFFFGRLVVGRGATASEFFSQRIQI